jgi:hypothetical protein
MSEQRRAERFSINEEFSTLGDEGSMTYVSDLSTNGVFVHTRHQIEIGQLLDLRFTLVLDDPVIIEARGRVVRCADEGVGVEFTDLRPDMVLRIHDAVARQRAANQEDPGLPTSSIKARTAAKPSFDDAKTGVFTVTEIPADELEDIDEPDDSSI